MMKEITSVVVLLALCIPALAADIPDMVGNWTGTVNSISWLKNTDWQATGKAGYLEDEYILAVEEQNGTRFAGKLIRADNPMASVVVLGAIESDNETISMVDEAGYLWGLMTSPAEMELSYQVVDLDFMYVGEGIFTKELQSSSPSNATSTRQKSTMLRPPAAPAAPAHLQPLPEAAPPAA
jgi:hypothetical protein